ncbi:MAG: response regulator [Anaerolineae bacterium]|nr:response regulator [Anaerolineae bacterium]
MVKILVAEDERDIRELIAYTLMFAGYDVIQVSNGADAVDVAVSECPDVILMDVRMPRMTGYQACEVLKQKPETQDTPVIFLSAKGQESEIQQGLGAGAVKYILKPFAPDELTSQVENVLKEIGKI